MRPRLLCFLLVCVLGCAQAPPGTVVIRRVVDGDTVELRDGRRVRYLGIDTPEVRRRAGERWVYDPEPFGEAAMQANRDLVGGQRVRLEFDQRLKDKYGRLLAYVYVDEVMVNEELLRQGLAEVLIIQPNVRHTDRLISAEQDAKDARRGLWQD